MSVPVHVLYCVYFKSACTCLSTISCYLLPTARESSMKKISMDEQTFRWMMNEDEMANDKLSEGIRKFAADAVKLENIILKKLSN